MSARLRYAVAFLAFQWQCLGFLGKLGLALCLGAAVYGLAVMPGNHAEIESLGAEIARVRADQHGLEQQLANASDAAGDAADGATDVMQSAIVIPMATDAPALLLTLEDIARRNGLQIKRNEYRYADPASPSSTKAKLRPAAGPSRFVEVRINAPARGSYGGVRAFLDEVRREIPALALDDISLKRGSIGEGEVQAVLRFSLFVRKAK